MAETVENLRECIRSLNVKRMRHTIDELPQGSYQDFGLLEEVCRLKDTPTNSTIIRDFIFMLVDFGVDPNSGPWSQQQRQQQNVHYQPPLAEAIYNRNVTALRTLLQCSTDLLQLKEIRAASLTSEMRAIIRQFQPGMWIAVHSGNIADVRRLINLWVRMDIFKYGKSLIELAESLGNEQIIKLITGIYPTMKLVHHVLARDEHKVRMTLRRHADSTAARMGGPTLRLNLRHLAGQGATVLYYAIRNGDSAIAGLLVEAGAQLFTLMRDAQSVECPVLFTALDGSLSLEMVDALISKTAMCESILRQLLYKSQGLLEVAVRNRVPPDSFGLLLSRGGPLLLIQRNCHNQSARDVADDLGLHAYCLEIDLAVSRWLRQSRPRQLLALHGYPRLQLATEQGGGSGDGGDEELPEDAQMFLKALPEYCEWIEYLSEAIYNNDMDAFQRLSTYQGEHSELFHCDLLWNARVCGDALPLLHKAVLNKNKAMVLEILDAMELHESIDILVDEFYRTALHYALAMRESSQTKEIVALLYEFGASEHCLDKFGKEPLDFKEHSGTPAMESYLEKVRERQAIPAELESEIWRQRSRKVREYKVQTHQHPHAHSHEAPGSGDVGRCRRKGNTISAVGRCKTGSSIDEKETDSPHSDEVAAWNACILQ